MSADPLQQWPVPAPGERPIVTPGPWGIAPETNGTEFVAYSANPWRVRAVLFRGDFSQNPNWRADTKAMAAVPAMIAALQLAEEKLGLISATSWDGPAKRNGDRAREVIPVVQEALQLAGVL